MPGRSWHASGQTVRVPVHEPEQIYLKFLLENRPSKNMTDEQLAELAPWSEKLQSIKNRM